jgi:hypothetical protein
LFEAVCVGSQSKRTFDIGHVAAMLSENFLRKDIALGVVPLSVCVAFVGIDG